MSCDGGSGGDITVDTTTSGYKLLSGGAGCVVGQQQAGAGNSEIGKNLYRLADFGRSLQYFYGSGGGSGGARGSGHVQSGAGGNGGGLILIEAKHIIINAGGAIRSDGTNGGNGALISGTGSAAGGGGVGGGVIILICSDIVNNGTISANGGTKGNDYSGDYACSPAANGGNGLIIQVVG